MLFLSIFTDVYSLLFRFQPKGKRRRGTHKSLSVDGRCKLANMNDIQEYNTLKPIYSLSDIRIKRNFMSKNSQDGEQINTVEKEPFNDES